MDDGDRVIRLMITLIWLFFCLWWAAPSLLIDDGNDVVGGFCVMDGWDHGCGS